jgi:DNA-binding NtrC family response regulator
LRALRGRVPRSGSACPGWPFQSLRRSHPDLPVLIASGQPDIQEWEAFRQAHVAIIAKPFSVDEIQEKLAELGLPGRGN